MEEKSSLRLQLRYSLSQVDARQRTYFDSTILSLLTNHIVWRESQSVYAYFPIAQECNITPLFSLALQQHKSLYVPLPHIYPREAIQYVPSNSLTYYCDTQYYMAPQGKITRVPIPRHLKYYSSYSDNIVCSLSSIVRKNIAIILVPGLGFSVCGSRLGRGGGYYDRLLAITQRYSTITSIGICYSTQLVSDIPQESHDMKVDYILHEQGIIQTRNRV